MMQRYIVFLNDREVIIDQEVNSPDAGLSEMNINFTGKSALVIAFKHFCLDLDCLKLRIKVEENISEACDAFNSMFTRIEAAGGIVRNQQNKYLFIKRLGLWDLPKGKLHKTEPAREGALREVTEETGLTKLTISRQLPSTYHIYTDRKGTEVLKETYWFEMICNESQKLVPQLEEDITEVKWFSHNELSVPMQNTYASLRNLLKGYLQV